MQVTTGASFDLLDLHALDPGRYPYLLESSALGPQGRFDIPFAFIIHDHQSGERWIIAVNHDGSMDLNILIRTLECSGDQLRFRAGAGIVSDSVPASELEETRAKARGVLSAIKGRGK